jgi:hypothetical protein
LPLAARPLAGGLQQRCANLAPGAGFEEAEKGMFVTEARVVGMVHTGADAPHHLALLVAGDKQGDLRLAEHWVVSRGKLAAHVTAQRRHPQRVVGIQTKRQLDERVEIAPREHRPDLNHGASSSTSMLRWRASKIRAM